MNKTIAEGDDLIIFISPHPDDLEISFGATAYSLISNHNTKICQIVVTDGSDEVNVVFDKKVNPEQYIRKVEQRQHITNEAAKILNILGTIFLRIPENILDKDENTRFRVAEQIVDIINIMHFYRDKCIVIFAPSDKDENPDHKSVAEVLKFFLKYNKSIVKSLYLYQTWPNDRLVINPNTIFYYDENSTPWIKKKEAVMLHNKVDHYTEKSNTGTLFWNNHITNIQKMYNDYYDNENKKKVEIFEQVDPNIFEQ
jgi:LmbE family N-acetylglucosaminyl deacetylase